jgi:hypothetical protein
VNEYGYKIIKEENKEENVQNDVDIKKNNKPLKYEPIKKYVPQGKFHF